MPRFFFPMRSSASFKLPPLFRKNVREQAVCPIESLPVSKKLLDGAGRSMIHPKKPVARTEGGGSPGSAFALTAVSPRQPLAASPGMKG